MEIDEKPFEPIAMSARKFSYSGQVLYRVYRSETESKLVEADNAALAVAESGYEYVMRVIREHENVLKHMPLDMLDPLEEKVMSCTKLRDITDEGFTKLDASMIPDLDEDQFESIGWDEVHPEQHAAAQENNKASAESQNSACKNNMVWF